VRRSSAVIELLSNLLIDNCQVEELRELRQTISSRENITGSQRSQDAHDDPPLISSVSPSSAYHSCFDGEDVASDQPPNQFDYAIEIAHFEGAGNQEGESDGFYQNELNVASSLSLQANASPANKPRCWDVEPNSNSTAALNLNLAHKLTLKGVKRVAFSTDGKYLATASSLGVVSIFNTRTGERVR